MRPGCAAAAQRLSSSPAGFRSRSVVPLMVIANRSPRVSVRQASASFTPAIARSRLSARALAAAIVLRSVWWFRCHARSRRLRRVTSASACALSRISGSPDASAFDLGERERVIADVLDLAGVQPAAHHLVDEPGFALDRLPGVGIKAAFHDVTEDLYLWVLVPLP